MTNRTEFLLDYPAFRAGQIKLAFAPQTEIRAGGIGSSPKVTWSADDFATAYGGMTSYESALDAAGYAREADMREPDAPIFVTMGAIDDDGALHISTPSFSGSVTAAQIYAAHGLSLPEAAGVVVPEDDNPSP